MKILFSQGQFNHGIKLYNSSMKIEKHSPSHWACFNLNYLEKIYRYVNAVSDLVKGRGWGCIVYVWFWAFCTLIGGHYTQWMDWKWDIVHHFASSIILSNVFYNSFGSQTRSFSFFFCIIVTTKIEAWTLLSNLTIRPSLVCFKSFLKLGYSFMRKMRVFSSYILG